MLTYGSVCSGIEAASVAWEPLGFKPLWFSEIEPFPCAVLAHHWPNTPNHGDMTNLADAILSGQIPAPDILVGGTPCQAFSVAGGRESLNDERGNLTLELVRLLDAIDIIRKRNGEQPAILVWENVPGILSTKDNALGCFLGALAGECLPLQPAGGKWSNAGFVSGKKRKIAWRILDAQFFGVPQRRRRIFLVASARDDISVAKILFEQQSCCGDFAPSTREKTAIAKTLTTRTGLRGNASTDDYIVVNGRQDPVVSSIAGVVDTQANTNIVINSNIINKTIKSGGNGKGVINDNTMYTLTATDRHAVMQLDCVRRLTPVECERLQGFSDNHTCIPYRNKCASECPDTPRFKAIGNSMAVPVMRWIGRRIKQYTASI
ncbi:DNA cytosine methyltransferase [Snodgrassella alvi]|jgi:DNA (cytosine-5)-methyltransferase 1|uniref:DNA cytosine methyltransferase n=1 Tax=Snodgrassella alvi TaxID=1196083 RepID=UPI000C1DC909|nr:DNA cytosine methyltransferase [Snodgrassella alvi]PIT48895.1 DNA (cytosine-5-)-methyltransferase [Snodgrassella alvi]